MIYPVKITEPHYLPLGSFLPGTGSLLTYPSVYQYQDVVCRPVYLQLILQPRLLEGVQSVHHSSGVCSQKRERGPRKWTQQQDQIAVWGVRVLPSLPSFWLEGKASREHRNKEKSSTYQLETLYSITTPLKGWCFT